ncbi:MAG: glycosyltransferase [Anaerolineales bacterium]|nr:glycosyltransferase [Anaerolineales bacterium]
MTVLRPVKIVYFIGQLGLGGSERQLYLLLKHIDKRRFECHVIVFNPSRYYSLDKDLQKTGVEVHAIPPAVKGIPKRVLWLYKLLCSIRPDIIHSWSVHDNAYAAVVGRMSGRAILIGSERISLRDPDFHTLGRIYRWLIIHGVQKHVVNTESIAKELGEFHVRQEDIFTLPNCVESFCKSEAPFPLQGILPDNCRIVGMVANLRRQKNYPLFIRAMIPVLEKFPDVIGLLVGQPVPSDPEVPDQVLQAIEQSGYRERLRWVGFQKEISGILNRLSVFCLTSTWEGTPNVVLEAMAAGLPVVATKVDGVVKIIQDGVSGKLVEPGNVEQVSNALCEFLSDEALSRRMGKKGKAFVRKNMSCSGIVRMLTDYYLGLLEERSV